MLRKLLLVAFALLSLSICARAEDQPQQPKPPKWPGTPIEPAAVASGRYQIVLSAFVARQAFLLDTWTGRVWLLVTDKKENLVWEEMDKFNLK